MKESIRSKYRKGKKVSKGLLRYHLSNKGVETLSEDRESLREIKEDIKDKTNRETNG